MNKKPEDATNLDPWAALRDVTSARIAIGRVGGSITTRELLDFKLSHARARDAVRAAFSAEDLALSLQGCGLEVLEVASAAKTTDDYLKRPDLGRRLTQSDRNKIKTLHAPLFASDVVLILSNGLSAQAIMRNGPAVVTALLPLLAEAGISVAPLLIATNARVALQDEVGEMLGVKLAVILLGERPGLGSADSLSAYLVFNPKLGHTDADRNCISNIRDGGLKPELAAQKIAYLIRQALQLKLSGVALKDESPRLAWGEN